ncbi:MAG TPA: c-type cytochrome biogenesis protein CcmI [Usitatibacter sp.]|nr:c-type cytochrome biogenesis protein CcmI [Usitatibacter sp.]
MLVFWLLAALMVLLALAFILVPLLRSRADLGPSVVEANLDVLRSQRREIDADVATGVLPADARDEALAELVDRARGDLSAPASPAATAPRRPWIVAAIAAVALPLIAFGMYRIVGAPFAADESLVAHEGAPMSDEQVALMVDRLAKKVRDRPDDVEGWALLARSYAALGRFPDAVRAYEHLAKLVPADASVLADWADALGMAQGRSLAGRPMEIVKRALDIDPNQPKALALAGTAALDAGEFEKALGYWKVLRTQLPPDSPDLKQVDAVIAEVHERAQAAGKPLPAEPQPAPSPGGAATLAGSVTVSPRIASRVDPAATLFVFARAEDGPRMPLAVVRATAAQLPMKFRLDDSQAMAPEMQLSRAKAVRVEARISRSGNAMPQPGDLVGTSAVVKPGDHEVKVVIDSVVGGDAAAAKLAPASTTIAKADSPASGSVTGSVTVAPQVAAKVDGSATLFVFARAENGPRMPLAVVRAPARELPLHFKLDDSQAMSPDFKLSNADAVRIEARISRSGNAAPQPGDLVGSSGIVKPGARGVNVVVDKVLQ